jgi:hypothetical protein
MAKAVSIRVSICRIMPIRPGIMKLALAMPGL